MTPQIIFPLDLILGYVAWLLCFDTYIWPRLKAMEGVHAQQAIATLHSFRFLGLVFVPGVVGLRLPELIARIAAPDNDKVHRTHLRQAYVLITRGVGWAK
jgi:hypothetical protein